MGRKVAVLGVLGAALLALSACSSGAPSSVTSSLMPQAPAESAMPSMMSSVMPSMEGLAEQTLAAAAKVVGMPEDEAVATLEGDPSLEISTRVVSRDGVDFPVTMDYSPSRVNLWIEEGVVTNVSVG